MLSISNDRKFYLTSQALLYKPCIQVSVDLRRTYIVRVYQELTFIHFTMRNIIEIREIRESSYEISEYVHTFFQKVCKRVQHLDFHQKCVRTLADTDFLNSCPIICKSLRKLCKSGKVFIVVQLRTFCTSIQELVMFLVNSNFFVNICRFV